MAWHGAYEKRPESESFGNKHNFVTR